MSLFDAYDPHSEELIKPSLQRSYREEESSPSTRSIPCSLLYQLSFVML